MKTMFFISVLLISTAAVSLQMPAQTALDLRVTDKFTGGPVENASVMIKPGELTGITDEDGRINFKDLMQNSLTVTVSRIGYKLLSIKTIPELNKINLINIELEQSEILSGEVKIYSTRTENQIRYAILPVSLITKKDFDFLPVISVPDFMKSKPGVNLVRDGMWASDINIRGLSRDNVIVYINGSRVETANNQAARFSLIDENAIERVEIIKGGVSSIYGSGGTGGMVSIKTLSGDFSKKINLKGIISGEFFSVNKLSGTGISLMLSSKKIKADLFSSFREASDTKSPSGIIPNSSFRDYGISFSAGIKLNKDQEAGIEYQKFKSPYAGIPGSYPLFPDNAKVSYIPADRDMFAVNYKISRVSDLIKNISARFYLQNIFRNTEVLPNSSVFMPASGSNPAKRIDNILINPEGKHYTKGMLLQNELQKGNSKLVSGIDAWQRRLTTSRKRKQIITNFDSAGNIISVSEIITGDIPIPDSRYTSIGIFLNDETSFLNDRIYVNAGGRVDGIFVSNDESLNPFYTITNGVLNNTPPGQKVLWKASENNDISWSFNGGLNYLLTDKLHLSGNFSASFRSPSLEERYQYIDLGNIVRIGNPALKPELGYFISSALKYWSGNMNISFETFVNLLSDLISEIPGTYENRQALIKTNIGKARLAGFDFDVDYNFYKSFVFYANASFVNGENTEDNSALPQIPPLNGTIGIKFSAPKYFSVNLNSVLFAAQNRVAAGEIKTPGYNIFNFYTGMSGLRLGSVRLNITAGVENIFNVNYRDHLSTSRGSYVSEPGRNIFLKSGLVF
ncbi:MAG: TonB-dependent receptor [Bacteroidetes bacterium]|nr:TonB-dependent receptor [Bacteroidota bacterium]